MKITTTTTTQKHKFLADLLNNVLGTHDIPDAETWSKMDDITKMWNIIKMKKELGLK